MVVCYIRRRTVYVRGQAGRICVFNVRAESGTYGKRLVCPHIYVEQDRNGGKVHCGKRSYAERVFGSAHRRERGESDNGRRYRGVERQTVGTAVFGNGVQHVVRIGIERIFFHIGGRRDDPAAQI